MDSHAGFDYIDEGQECAYLKDKYEKIHYTITHSLTPEQLSHYIKYGWRRFGAMIHRPICEACDECRSLRFDVNEFQFSKSVRRIVNKNKDLKIQVGPLVVDDERVNLYNQYHLRMEEKKGWEYREIDHDAYQKSFLSCHTKEAYEITYRLDGALIAIDIIDTISDGVSSTYFVYNPNLPDRSLGKFSVYYNVLLARKHKLQWIYLGYYVKDCGSLAYKTQFKPYSVLLNRPKLNEQPIWSDLQYGDIPKL